MISLEADALGEQRKIIDRGINAATNGTYLFAVYEQSVCDSKEGQRRFPLRL